MGIVNPIDTSLDTNYHKRFDIQIIAIPVDKRLNKNFFGFNNLVRNAVHNWSVDNFTATNTGSALRVYGEWPSSAVTD